MEKEWSDILVLDCHGRCPLKYKKIGTKNKIVEYPKTKVKNVHNIHIPLYNIVQYNTNLDTTLFKK